MGHGLRNWIVLNHHRLWWSAGIVICSKQFGMSKIGIYISFYALELDPIKGNIAIVIK